MTDFADSNVESGRDFQAAVASSFQTEYLTPTSQDFYVPKSVAGTSTAADKLAVYTTPPVSPPGSDIPLASRRFDQAYSFERMDSDERYRTQYRTSAYNPEGIAGTSGQQLTLPSSAQPRHQQTVRPDLSVTAASQTPSVPAYGNYSYTDPSSFGGSSIQSTATQGASMSYSQEYANSQARQQQAQQTPSQYSTYSSNVVYPSGQTGHAGYQAVPAFQQRHQSASVDLSGSYGASQYYGSADAANPAVPTIPSQYVAAPMDTGAFQQPAAAAAAAAARPAMPQSYPVSVSPYDPSVASDPMQQRLPNPPEPSPGEAFDEWRRTIPKIFEDIRDGRLEIASKELMQISDWLGKAVVPYDQSDVYKERLDLWEQFNLCWLALGQKQKELTTQMLETGQQPPSLLSLDDLRTMGNGLVQLCEILEPHGLVDYELGVWEEEITSILIQCRELLEGDSQEQAESASETRPSTSRS